MTLKCVPFGTSTALLTALYNNSRMAKITPTTAANHTQQTNSYASHTPLSSKLGYISKIAKPGMPNPTMKKHGQISKHTSTMPNACSVTNFAQPNRLALPATSPSTPIPTKPNHPPEYREALVNLTTSASTDRKLLTTLATTVTNINDHIQKINKAPIASVHNSETTNLTALSSITSSVSDLQQQLANLKCENEQLCNKHNRRPCTRWDNSNYCWTHGYRVGNKHNSATCQNKAPSIKTMLHAKTPWAAAKPTNPPTLYSEGGVF